MTFARQAPWRGALLPVDGVVEGGQADPAVTTAIEVGEDGGPRTPHPSPSLVLAAPLRDLPGLLPGFTIEKTLRLRVDVTQTFAVTSGENPVRSVRFLYLKECMGELARIASLPGETGATFEQASEFRVLDVGR